MKFDFNNLMQGLAGNMSEENIDDLQNEYKNYLLEDEVVESGYKLIRDSIVFTNIRILFIDKQGATGKKVSFKSIFLSQIVNVEMETAGFGLDDSEITITYLENIYLKPREEKLKKQKFEFPKNTEITDLYKYLFQLAYTNRESINQNI